MKRAEVYKIHPAHPVFVDDKRWVADFGDRYQRFPTHAAALAHAVAEVGLTSKDDRCTAQATDPVTTHYPREDSWRCGHAAGHTGNHELFTSDGDDILFAGRWKENR